MLWKFNNAAEIFRVMYYDNHYQTYPESYNNKYLVEVDERVTDFNTVLYELGQLRASHRDILIDTDLKTKSWNINTH